MSHLLTVIEGPLATITFNRPEVRNAVSGRMLVDMRDFLRHIEHDPSVRCIVIRGAGEHFMSGGDVAGFATALAQPATDHRSEFEGRIQSAAQLFLQLARMPQPIVTRVQGAAVGAAIGIIAGADFAICGETARFTVAQVRIGASPDGALTYHLPRLLGVRKTMELAILGNTVTAREAASLGLVNNVVPDGELDQAVIRLVDQILAAPRLSVRHAKALIQQSLNNSLEEQLQLEAEAFGECASSADFVEGVDAFLQKRKAIFNITR